MRRRRNEPARKVRSPIDELAVQRAPDDVGIGEVVADRADRGEQRCPSWRAAARAARLAVVEVVGQPPIALDQEAVEAEDLHFLGGLDAGARSAAHSRARAAPACGEIERVALRVEMRLAEEGRHQRQQQQHDQPRRIDDQAGGEAHHRDDVLRLAEQLAHQRHAPAGLPARPLELVLELGVLEVLEVERRGVLHQPHAGGVGHALGQQAVDQRHDAPEHVREHRQAELGQQAAYRASSAGRCRAIASSVPGLSGICTSITTSSMISLPT